MVAFIAQSPSPAAPAAVQPTPTNKARNEASPILHLLAVIVVSLSAVALGYRSSCDPQLVPA
jgi:hypothetical protein